MHTRRMISLSTLIAMLVASTTLIAPGVAQAADVKAPEAPQVPLDIPEALIADGVSGYTLASPKVFWNTEPLGCPPSLVVAADGVEAPAAPVSPESPSVNYDEYIRRISIYGSESRDLWFHTTTNCNLGQTIASNIVADDNYIYWTTGAALVRLSTDANVGDAPETVTTAISGTVELAIDNSYVLAIKVTGSNPNYMSRIWTVSKSDNTVTLRATRNALARKIQSSYGNRLLGTGNYLFWLESGNLRRFDLGDNGISTPATGVVGYYAEGATTTCSLSLCFFSQIVFISRNNGTEVVRYDNVSGNTTTPIYTTTERVYELYADASNLFMLQEFTVPCAPEPCFNSFIDRVLRRGRSSSGGTATLYFTATPSIVTNVNDLKGAGDFIFWREDGRLQRLPKDAAALPNIDMTLTGMSITQGIQKPDNSVLLVQGRRTFVRVFAKSLGANVPGATARLYRTNSGGTIIDGVSPVNSVGINITVRSSPQRANLNDSFLFELPWHWLPTSVPTKLYLKAVLNPYHAPIEPNYNNNEVSSGALTFNASAALKVQFVAWGYSVNGASYYPNIIKDVTQTFTWIIRAYPIASKIIFDGMTGSQPGFHPNAWYVFDDTLGAKVMRTHADCQDLVTYNDNGTIKDDDRSLCASRYTNQQMVIMRSDNGQPESRFFYGFISDGAKFPRGQACCGTAVSSGPTGPGTQGWDFDGTYGDWYAGHEIAHTFGRAHPNPNSDDPATKNTVEGCGHSRSDPNYPHSQAFIGASADTEGFDAGEPSLSVPRAVYPGNVWHDVMSYCDNQWVSDYTYEGTWAFMTGNPSVNAAMAEVQPEDSAKVNEVLTKLNLPLDVAQVAAPASVAVSGDFLVVQGSIIPDPGTATIGNLQRKTSVVGIPPLVAGGYSIRLFDAGTTQLADYAFTPEGDDDNTLGALTINQIVNFLPGTRHVKIIRLSDGAVLATAYISPNAPAVSNVVLQGTPDPVAGTVTLAWNASDADGGALTFDIFYSKDGGATLQPVKVGVTGNSTSIDTNVLGGGSAIFRVVASDGANSGQSDSPIYTFANKPPMPMILTPGNTLHIHYGQLVNFSGTAMDWQDGGVTGVGLQWSSNLNGALGVGELVSSQTLKVGTHTISLQATNSKGQSATATVTVIVDDNLDLLGPTLTAGPTQFGWQFAADATTGSAQVLEIGNAGDGTLNWTATTDAPWLSLNVAGGTAPGSITLAANPAGVPNGSVLQGTVTLVAPPSGSQPTQTLTIPVGMAKGVNGYIGPLNAGPRWLNHLPLVTK